MSNQTQSRRMAHILEVTRDKALNVSQLAGMMCLSPYRTREYLKQMHREHAVYIERWEKGPNAPQPMACYRKGDLPDAPRPMAEAKKALPVKSAPIVALDDNAEDLRLREIDRRKAIARANKHPVQQHPLVNALFGRPLA